MNSTQKEIQKSQIKIHKKATGSRKRGGRKRGTGSRHLVLSVSEGVKTMWSTGNPRTEKSDPYVISTV